jgi:tetratricopeptide (TPR) repeat protein/DNA-binding CsgD family transcriptional regulator
MKTKYFAILYLSAITCFGQKVSQLDSLQEALRTSPKDSTRIDALHDLWRYFLSYQPDKSIEYAEEIVAFSKQIDFQNGLGRGYLYLGVVASQQSDFEKSREYLQRAYEVFKNENDQKGLAIATSNFALDYFYQSKYDSAIDYNREAESYFLQIGDSLKLGSIYILNSAIYLEKGFFDLSLKNGIKSAQYFLKLGDTVGYAKAMYNNACVYESLENKKAAKDSYYEVIPIFKKHNILYTLALVHQGLGILYTKDPVQADSARINLQKAIDIGKEMQDTVLIATALNEYGRLQKVLRQYDTAKGIYEESIALSRAVSSGFSEQIALLDLGEVYLETNELEAAEEVTMAALALNRRLGVDVGINRAYENLYRIYKAQNDPDKALFYVEAHLAKKDSIYGIEKANKINELQTIYETEKKEADLALQAEEIRTLNEKAKVDTLTKGLYAGGMVSAFALSGLLVFGFRQRIRKNRIAREKQEEIYRQEIEHKKKELATQTLHLVQKNTFIQELKENLESIKKSPDTFKTEFRRIVMLLKKENASDKDWEVFKTYFAEVHNDFDQKLKTLYSEISEKEIRLAAFLRMNLTTKEIAATLNVLPESVLKSKYRLKRKLGLDKEMDLTRFLNSL